ncbi:MAG: hypothetical protein ACXWYS_01025 [Gaiellaceae bacterium]
MHGAVLQRVAAVADTGGVNTRFSGSAMISLLMAVVVAGVLWQTGVFGGGSSSSATSPEAVARDKAQANAVAAQSNLLAAGPAAQAYFAEHGTYEGLTLTPYDASATGIAVVRADAASFCLQTAAGTQVFSLRGPGGGVVPGPC